MKELTLPLRSPRVASTVGTLTVKVTSVVDDTAYLALTLAIDYLPTPITVGGLPIKPEYHVDTPSVGEEIAGVIGGVLGGSRSRELLAYESCVELGHYLTDIVEGSRAATNDPIHPDILEDL